MLVIVDACCRFFRQGLGRMMMVQLLVLAAGKLSSFRIEHVFWVLLP